MHKYLFHILFLCLLINTSAYADVENPWAEGAYVRARILSDKETPTQTALDVQMLEGWHTYWRVAGDSGLPPRFDWAEGSSNIKDVQVHYPFPKRIETAGFISFGYKDKVSFPLTVTLEDESKPAILKIKLDIMVCSDICVPDTVTVTSNLMGASAKLIERRKTFLPHQGNITDLYVESVDINKSSIVFSAYSQAGFDDTEIIVATDKHGFTGVTEVNINKKDPHRAVIKVHAIKGMESLKTFLEGKGLSILISNGEDMVEYQQQIFR